MNHTLTLLVDGYISRSFNSRAAEEYFFQLLKRNHIPACRVVSYAGIESRFFVVDSASPHVPIRAPSESPCVLDRSLTVMGTVVPQTMWSPVTVEDRRRLVGEAELQMPIFFEGADGKLGVPLEACAAGRCDGLINAQEFAQLGQRSIINIRVMWLGYKAFKCQVQIHDDVMGHHPVTVAKFAHHVGRAIDAFLKADQPDPGCVDWRSGRWRIGQGGIEPSDIMIIGAVEVSAGSWMPILQLTRYIF